MVGMSPSRCPGRTRPPASAPRSGDVQWAGTAWPSSMSSTGSPPQATSLIRTMASVVKVQNAKTGLWWLVMTHDSEPGNYFEASASCMFVYALAKGVRIGLLPQADEANAKRGWEGIQKQFITTNPDGTLI